MIFNWLRRPLSHRHQTMAATAATAVAVLEIAAAC